MIDQTETRQLVKTIQPDLQLWQWLNTGAYELVFDAGYGYSTSFHSNDIGYIAGLLVKNGSSKDHATAISQISQGVGHG